MKYHLKSQIHQIKTTLRQHGLMERHRHNLRAVLSNLEMRLEFLQTTQNR